MAARALEHSDHPLGRGRHDGQPVGHAAGEQRLVDVLELADLDLAGAQAALAARGARGQARRDLRITRPRGAAGPALGQAVEVEVRAGPRGQLGDPRAVQPLDTALLALAVEQDDRRHRLGVQPLGERQVGVDLGHATETKPRGLRGGLGRIRLRHDAHPGGVERGQHLVADRAVVRDQGDELGRRHRER